MTIIGSWAENYGDLQASGGEGSMDICVNEDGADETTTETECETAGDWWATGEGGDGGSILIFSYNGECIDEGVYLQTFPGHGGTKGEDGIILSCGSNLGAGIDRSPPVEE